MEEEGVLSSKRKLHLDQDEFLDDEGDFCSDDGFEEYDGASDSDEEVVRDDAELGDAELGDAELGDAVEGDDSGEEDDLVDDDFDESHDAGDEIDEEIFIENDDDLNDDKSEDVFVDEEDIVDVGNTYGKENLITGGGDGDDGRFGADVGGNHKDVYTTPTKRTTGPVIASPAVGMTFDNWEGLNEYYRSYGEQQGFGVVCMGGNRSQGKDNETGKSNSLRTYVWRCECHGRPKYRRRVNGKTVTCVQEPIVKRKTKKCGCPIMLYGARNGNFWVVKTVVNEHVNHVPTPTKSTHISMFRVRRITQTILKQMENDHDSGAPIAHIFNNLAGRRNGVENIGFTKKDMHNILNKRMRLRLRDGDAVAMINYLDKMTKDNQNFFHLHRLDKTGKLKDVMCVDARSRAAYQYFGDVVCFDSTYLTNKYELPFSNFVGVNHHGQTILLGWGLVSHEDAETFVWLFRSWLSCMGGKPPAAMMTDQDAAMRKAIRIAMPMPKTRHRWCMWHIMQKFSRKLGSLTDFPQIKVALQNVIYNSLTPEEFEEDWLELSKLLSLRRPRKAISGLTVCNDFAKVIYVV
ncbi:protein FAR-RED IMPAIRED RESPONSE 1-like [Spinacia oleracea]|uniref:Protein FAR-RED IMPAIRED RESPONSE 1-like n=1 Tax=Spinacia oleracea TaxID=3562 RepID=A0A9R0J1V5_SPIOL|nr:protein FAR-RED IMPAIRED RESPONSE 1-like [Spinacia oleracea]